MKKGIFLRNLYVLFLCAAGFLYAGGSKDITTISIDSMESWQETVDISSKKRENIIFL